MLEKEEKEEGRAGMGGPASRGTVGLQGAWQAQRRRLHELMFAEHSLCARFHSCCSAHTSLFHLPRDLRGSYYHGSFVYRENKHSLKPYHKPVGWPSWDLNPGAWS